MDPNGLGYLAAIDQGTTSTRAVIVDSAGRAVGAGQYEHRQILKRQGWVEHDPMELWQNTRRAMAKALAEADIARERIVGLGISNQRETAVVWDKKTGRPIYNAIVWQDTRTVEPARELAGAAGPTRWQDRTGLLINSYPSGPKVAWILDHVPGARRRAEHGELAFGTVDSWLLWNATGGARGDNGRPAVHATDVTNASRTLLMNLRTLEWDEELCAEVGVPQRMLPEIRPSVGYFGRVRARGSLAGVPITAMLGDQQSAMMGQGAVMAGQAKTTYGTGLFLLQNTGHSLQRSRHGLLSTVAYQVAGERPVYALEGSVAVGGSLVQWLRDQLGIINRAPEVETLARGCADNGGVYVVPAFSGLFAPRWRDDARGTIVGLTRFANRHHLARAVLETTAFQVREVIDAMFQDARCRLRELHVDGGMTDNDLLMQFQADLLGVDVVRPASVETTVTGACYAAGLGAGVWDDVQDLSRLVTEGRRWRCSRGSTSQCEDYYRNWSRAVERSYGWADERLR